MKTTFLLAGIALTAILWMGCGKNGSDGDPNPNPQAGQYLTFTRDDGQHFEFHEDSIVSILFSGSELVAVTDGVIPDKAQLDVYAPYPVTVNDTTLNFQDGEIFMLQYTDYEGSKLYRTISGQVHIELGEFQLDFGSGLFQTYQIFEGTFQGVLVEPISSNPDTVVITNGTFRGHRLL